MLHFKALFLFQAIFLVLAQPQTEQLHSIPNNELPIRKEDCPLIDDPAHPVLLPHDYDCTKYYSCIQGLAYPMTCPNELHWSSITYRCDQPNVAKCQQKINPIIPTTIPSILPPIIPPYQPYSKFLPYTTDCSKYYQCQVQECPAPLLWNAYTQSCSLPALSTCTNDMQPQRPTEAPYVPPITKQPFVGPPTAATPPPSSPNFTPNYPLWPIPNDSNQPGFPGIPYINQKELDQLCMQEGLDYIHYPGDCHRFIQCNGFAYVQKCPANLYWNAESLTCDRFCK